MIAYEPSDATVALWHPEPSVRHALATTPYAAAATWLYTTPEIWRETEIEVEIAAVAKSGLVALRVYVPGLSSEQKNGAVP